MVDPGEGPRRPGPPLFLDQNEAKKIFLRLLSPPYLRVWMTAPPPLSEGLDPPLGNIFYMLLTELLTPKIFQLLLNLSFTHLRAQIAFMN